MIIDMLSYMKQITILELLLAIDPSLVAFIIGKLLLMLEQNTNSKSELQLNKLLMLIHLFQITNLDLHIMD